VSALTLDLARLASGLRLCDLSDPAQHWAKRAITDTLACALAGVNEPAVRLAVGVLPASPGPSLVFGTGHRLHPLDAAQINGIAAHALDFDDCNLEMDGHPSVSIVPGLFALAEARNASGAQVLTAYVAGVEAEIRLARIANPAHAERGWHPTVTFGVIGAAVAAAHLMRISPEHTATAMSIAASSAAGLRANSGTMTKPFHAGQANRNGVQAALLAEAGYTARLSALEHKFGFLRAFGDSFDVDPGPALDGWGKDFALLSPGIAIKQYPCCAFIHCAIDAAAQLRGDIKTAQIERIEVALHHKRLKNIDRPMPKDGLDAKFSTQHLTARALIDGTVGLDDFRPERVFDPTVVALAAKVALVPHEEGLSMGRVHVWLADGRHLSAEATVAMGRDPSNPMTQSQVRAKFHDCVPPSDQSTALFDALMQLETFPSLAPITAAMCPPPPK